MPTISALHRLRLLANTRTEGDAVSTGRGLHRPERAGFVRITALVGHVGPTLLFDQRNPTGEQLHRAGDDVEQHRLQRFVTCLGNFDGLRHLINASQVLAVQDQAVRGFTLYLRGGRMKETEVACLESLQIVREVGPLQRQGTALHNPALAREARWRPEDAHADFEAAIAIYRSRKSYFPLGECLGHLVLLHARQGRHAEALRCLDEGEAQLGALSDKWLLGILLCDRAEAMHWAGDATAAGAALASATALAAETEAAEGSELGAAPARAKTLVGSD